MRLFRRFVDAYEMEAIDFFGNLGTYVLSERKVD